MTTPAAAATGTDTQSPVLTTAQNLLASRMEVIQPLADAIAERKRLQELMEAAEKTYGAAYAAAQAAGWTPGELRQMGADEPTRRPQGRPRGSSRSKPKSAPAASAPNPRTPDPAESRASASPNPA